MKSTFLFLSFILSVNVFCQNLDIEEKDSLLFEQYLPDLEITVSNADFVKKWNNKIINIHPSLLPAFKGLNTHERAIQKKVKFSGCTVHFVDKNIDSGKIIDQEVVRVLKSDDAGSLQKKILMKEHKLYIRVLKYLERKNGKV